MRTSVQIIIFALILLGISLFLNSCIEGYTDPPEIFIPNSGDEVVLTQQVPNPPEFREFDFDGDGVSDFGIRYYDWHVQGTGVDRGIAGNIYAIGNNEILGKIDAKTFFLDASDGVWQNPNPWSPYYWQSGGADFVEIYNVLQDGQEYWPTEWTILSDKERDYYYLGIKIVNGSLYQLGRWKLEIDSKTGEMTDWEVELK